MTDYRRCELCGALVKVSGLPDFPGDERPVTLHYQPACDALVRELAAVELGGTIHVMRRLQEWAQRLVEAMDND